MREYFCNKGSNCRINNNISASLPAAAIILCKDSFKYIGATFVKQTDYGIDTLIISYTIYLGDNKKALYEKDAEDVVQYTINDRVYYVMTNLDDRVIAWQNSNFEGAIMGNFTIEEAEKIIKSIDGE